MIYDVLILGGGTAGLSAALYCARFKLNCLLITDVIGGTGNEAPKVDNWIGTPGISGLNLMKNFIAHVKSTDVSLVNDTILNIKQNSKKFSVKCKNGNYYSKTIINAMGMSHRKLNVPGEKEFSGKGVHSCYVCDGPLYKEKIVALVGGSDSAALGALFMANYAKKVYLIYRGDKLKAEPINKNLILKNSKIEVIYNSDISKINGDDFVNSISLGNKELKIDGLFVEIGFIPNSKLCGDLGIKLDKRSFIKVNSNLATNIPGFFAAGDISNSTSLKQFITSASQGSIAAQSVYLFLRN